jgi:hypothetical protein
MTHVVAPDDAGMVGKTLGVSRVGRAQQQRGRVDRATGDDDDVTAIAFNVAIAPHHDLRHCPAGGAGLDALDKSSGQQRYIWMAQRWRDAHDLCIRLGLYQAGEAVAGGAANAGAVLRLTFVEHDADR